MTTYHKILLGLIAAAYFISPIDIIPDFFIPYLGWFDDTAVVGVILYYIKHGHLPDFLYKKRKASFRSKSKNFQYSDADVKRKPTGQNTADKNSQNSYKKESVEKQEQPPKTTPKSPYQILGLSPGASKEEIQSAYRNAVKQYHPDRVANLGPELQEIANKKFIEIKDAYNTLIKQI
ncbi:MAG: DnaJ domain-containing protein [Desulfamplus sp.]|nr:DnaJ domain-containing protein [Desulfamplus sp.]